MGFGDITITSFFVLGTVAILVAWFRGGGNFSKCVLTALFVGLSWLCGYIVIIQNWPVFLLEQDTKVFMQNIIMAGKSGKKEMPLADVVPFSWVRVCMFDQYEASDPDDYDEYDRFIFTLEDGHTKVLPNHLDVLWRAGDDNARKWRKGLNVEELYSVRVVLPEGKSCAPPERARVMID